MTKLSPAAKAILEAYDNSPWEYDTGDRAACAAVLRAVADQVVPEPDDWDKDNFSVQALRLRCLMRDQILAIAAELRSTTTTETP